MKSCCITRGSMLDGQAGPAECWRCLEPGEGRLGGLQIRGTGGGLVFITGGGSCQCGAWPHWPLYTCVHMYTCGYPLSSWPTPGTQSTSFDKFNLDLWVSHPGPGHGGLLSLVRNAPIYILWRILIPVASSHHRYGATGHEGMKNVRVGKKTKYSSQPNRKTR